MLYAVADVVDRSLARKNASELATLLGARSSSQQRNVVGEPTCPYKVRLNTDAFWFGVGVSDASYVVAGKQAATAVQIGHGDRFLPDQGIGTRLALAELRGECAHGIGQAEQVGIQRGEAAFLRSTIASRDLAMFHRALVQRLCDRIGVGQPRQAALALVGAAQVRLDLADLAFGFLDFFVQHAQTGAVVGRADAELAGERYRRSGVVEHGGHVWDQIVLYAGGAVGYVRR